LIWSPLLCNSWLVQWQSADGGSCSTLQGIVSIVFPGGIPIEDCLAGLLHSLGSCPGSNYRQSELQTSYTLHGHTLDVVDSGKYLGVTINKDLTWTKHINQTIGKASWLPQEKSGKMHYQNQINSLHHSSATCFGVCFPSMGPTPDYHHGGSCSTLQGIVSIVFAGGIPIEDCLAGLLHSLGSCPDNSYRQSELPAFVRTSQLLHNRGLQNKRKP
jgi:hypothetical protein